MVSRRPALLTLAALVLTLLLAACGGKGGSFSANNGPSGASTVDVQTNPKERLYVLDGDGFSEIIGGRHQLILAPPPQSFIYDASISRDGEQLAVAIQLPPQTGVESSEYNFGVDLYVNAAGSTQLTQLVQHQRTGEIVSRPNWVPGGKQIIFADYGRKDDGTSDLHIETIDVDTGQRQRLIDNAIEPALSPDGRMLAYVAIDQTTGAENLALRDLSTGESDLIISDRSLVNVSAIAWSPDGKRLAFASADPVTAPEQPAFVPTPITTSIPGTEPGAAATPPAASQLAHPTLADAWVVNLDGSGLARLTDLGDASLSLAWSADNQTIYALGDTGFWRIDAKTGHLDHLGEGVLAGRVQTVISN